MPKKYTGADRVQAFLARILTDVKGCWIWTGTKANHGYGVIRHPSKRNTRLLAHRVAWEIFRGPVPADRFVCHRCDVQLCVNPDHLFLGTHSDNIKDMVAKGRQKTSKAGGKRKLTRAAVLQIRAFALQGLSLSALSRMFGVTRTQIRNVINKTHWKHV